MKVSDNQSDSEDDKTDTDCDSSILVSPVKVNEEEKPGADKVTSFRDELGCPDGFSATDGDSGNKGDAITSGNTRMPRISKSASDVRKSKTATSGNAESVKKAISSTLLKKDTTKRTTSSDVKKDSKGKMSAKTTGKK